MHRLLIIFIVLNFNATAQINEGYLKFAIQILPIDTTQANLNAARMLWKSRMEISFAGDMYRIDSHIGDITDNTYIYNYSKGEILTLTSNKSSKFAHKKQINTEGTIARNDEGGEVIEYRDSTKQILGFKCYYVEVLNNGNSIPYWCTDEIDINFRGKSIMNPSIPGFPLWFQLEVKGFQMTYTAVNFIEEIDQNVFSTEIPEGYSESP